MRKFMESIYFYEGRPISELFSRKMQARIRYRITKKGYTVEQAVAEDEGDNGDSVNLVYEGKPLSDLVTRSAYLRIYNRVLNRTPLEKAIEAERAKHPECFLTEQEIIEKKQKISQIRKKVRNYVKTEK